MFNQVTRWQKHYLLQLSPCLSCIFLSWHRNVTIPVTYHLLTHCLQFFNIPLPRLIKSDNLLSGKQVCFDGLNCLEFQKKVRYKWRGLKPTKAYVSTRAFLCRVFLLVLAPYCFGLFNSAHIFGPPIFTTVVFCPLSPGYFWVFLDHFFWKPILIWLCNSYSFLCPTTPTNLLPTFSLIELSW